MSGHSLRLEPLAPEHYEELFRFEKDNRRWFEKFVPPRPASYEEFPPFTAAMNQLLEEQNRGESLFFLVFQEGRLAGRINLTEIQDNTAELGYRIGETHIGRGIASLALTQLAEEICPARGITTLSAMTTDKNKASRRVLEKNGFTQTKREKEAVILKGETMDFIHYRKELS